MTHPTPPSTSSEDAPCPACHVGPGHLHLEGCDVARCLATGLQRSSHPASCPCPCPSDTWTGQWPGQAECHEFGWTLPSGQPDLNRLYSHARWEPTTGRWMRDDSTPTSPGDAA